MVGEGIIVSMNNANCIPHVVGKRYIFTGNYIF